jgi:hypothetical protein
VRCNAVAQRRSEHGNDLASVFVWRRRRVPEQATAVLLGNLQAGFRIPEPNRITADIQRNAERDVNGRRVAERKDVYLKASRVDGDGAEGRRKLCTA